MNTPATSHGLRRIEFADFDGIPCDIAEWPCIITTIRLSRGPMILDQSQALWLSGLLAAFAATGRLPGEYEPAPER